jgi:hypothetical protein
VVLLRARSTAEVTSIAAAAKPLADKKSKLVYRLARFVLNDPGAAAVHAAQVTVSTEGKLRASAKVRGGKIKVRTGGKTKNLGSGLESQERFWLSYEGTDAPRTRWLQFIWREIEVHPPKGDPTYLGDTVGPATGNQYKLTTDKKKPNWNTDAAKDAASPFYEDSGINNRTENGTTMFDAPGSYAHLVNPQFDAPVSATKVISRAHFATYLVRDMEILEKIEIDVQWEFTSKTAPPRTFNVTQRGPVAAMDPGQKERLTAQFPKFAYLP